MTALLATLMLLACASANLKFEAVAAPTEFPESLPAQPNAAHSQLLSTANSRMGLVQQTVRSRALHHHGAETLLPVLVRCAFVYTFNACMHFLSHAAALCNAACGSTRWKYQAAAQL